MSEELKQFVQKVASASPETWANIETTLKESGTSLIPDAAEEMQEIYNQDILAAQPEDARLMHTARIFYSRQLTGYIAQADPYEVHVIDKTSPRTWTSKKGQQHTTAQVYGIGYKIPDDDSEVQPEVGLVKITFWNEDIEKAEGAEVGKTYRVMLNGGLEDGVWDVSATGATSWNKEVDDDNEMRTEEILEQLFPVVPIAEAPHNESHGYSDLKLVKGTVMNAYVRRSQKGNLYGRYVINDNTQTPDQVKEQGPFGVMCDPAQVRFAQNSEVYFLGRINVSDEYGPGMDAECIVPLLGIPKEVEIPEEPEAEEAEEEEELETDDASSVVDFSSL